MENGKQGAFSSVDLENQHFQVGLTKREYFAGLAMQGLLSIYDPQKDITPYIRNAKDMAELAVKSADELLKQLEK